VKKNPSIGKAQPSKSANGGGEEGCRRSLTLNKCSNKRPAATWLKNYIYGTGDKKPFRGILIS
jgi:hypothetical protein